MAIVDGKGIGYVGDQGTWSVYEVHLDGRAILEASVDNDDPDLAIWVGRPGARAALVSKDVMTQHMTGLPIMTKGRAKKGIHEVGGTPESPGELKDHIDGAVVQMYLFPRLVRLMADIYVPKSPID